MTGTTASDINSFDEAVAEAERKMNEDLASSEANGSSDASNGSQEAGKEAIPSGMTQEDVDKFLADTPYETLAEFKKGTKELRAEYTRVTQGIQDKIAEGVRKGMRDEMDQIMKQRELKKTVDELEDLKETDPDKYELLMLKRDQESLVNEMQQLKDALVKANTDRAAESEMQLANRLAKENDLPVSILLAWAASPSFKRKPLEEVVAHVKADWDERMKEAIFDYVKKKKADAGEGFPAGKSPRIPADAMHKPGDFGEIGSTQWRELEKQMAKEALADLRT